MRQSLAWRLWMWLVLVASVAGMVTLGYFMKYQGAEPVFGAFTIVLFTMSGSGAWLALYPNNLAEKFTDFSRRTARASTVIFALAIALGTGCILVGPHI